MSPVGICKGCGRQTNSATSDYWHKDRKPTECYAAFVKGKWVKGCAYDKTGDFERDFADGLIARRGV